MNAITFNIKEIAYRDAGLLILEKINTDKEFDFYNSIPFH